MSTTKNIPAGEVLLGNAGDPTSGTKKQDVVTAGEVLSSLSNGNQKCNQNDRVTADAWDNTTFCSSWNPDVLKTSYKMDHPMRGCFMIFNQEVFNGLKNPREGSRVDARNLEFAMRSLGFESVNTFHNLDELEILSWINRVAKANHTKYDCFGCAILSHGAEGDFIYARDQPFHVNKITDPFRASNCPSLAGKPKLFFIQACRGDKFDQGMLVKDDVVDGFREEKRPPTIPNEADFLIANSTHSGYVAWLNSGNGSWFIQCLCHCIREYGKSMDFLKVLTRVNNMVAHGFEASDDKTQGLKQIPSIASRLTKDIYFGSSETTVEVQEQKIQNQAIQTSAESLPQKIKKRSLFSRVSKRFSRR